MRSPVFRRQGCRRHAGTTRRRPQYATPEVVAGRHRAKHQCITSLTDKMIHANPSGSTAPHHLRGAIWVERFGTPRMSPRPRVAKYGVSHSCHRLPGWRKCTPPVIIAAAEGRYLPTKATMGWLKTATMGWLHRLKATRWRTCS